MVVLLIFLFIGITHLFISLNVGEFGFFLLLSEVFIEALLPKSFLDKGSGSEGDQKELNTNFLLSDNIWAKAKVPNTTGKVGLWLGANVMVEYTYAEAIVLLGKNLSNAEAKIKETEDDIDFLKD